MMAFYADHLHGRLDTLLKKINGYDFNYHVSKVARDEGIDRNIVFEIFRLTSNNEARAYYIKAYKNGYTLNFIKESEEERLRKSFGEFNALFRTLGNYSNLNLWR